MKIHKYLLLNYSMCGIRIYLGESSHKWKNVTCKRCLKLKKNRKGV